MHDSTDDSEELLRTHPLARAGVLRHLRLEPGTGTASRQRNAGWRAARAPLIAFTDDDCRPEPYWLERLLGRRRQPRRDRPGRHQARSLRGRDHEVRAAAALDRRGPAGPARPDLQHPLPAREAEEVGGFDESIETAGEDLDLAARLWERGVPYVGAPDALTYHAVDAFSLLGAVRFNERWVTLPLVFKRHPKLREQLEYGVFWKRRHAFLPAAVAGALLHRREPLLALLALPYVLHALPHRGSHPMGRMRASAELAGRAVVDASEIWTMVKGSVRYRTTGAVRVALLSPCFFPEVKRGTERIVQQIGDGLIERGHQARLITSHPGGRRGESSRACRSCGTGARSRSASRAAAGSST